MSRLLQGKTVVVTGAGHSVGRAVARRASEEGARVMLACEDGKGLEAAVRDLGGDGDRVAHFGCDLEERLSVTNLLAATQDAFGRIDVLVDAARHTVSGSFLEIDVEDFDAALSDNLRSVFLLARATAKKMIAQRERDPEFRGAIVTVTSISARRTVPELFAHSVSCAALDQLTRSMATCLAEHRIRVNGVALGSVMTQTLRNALREREDLREEMVRVTPLGRIGEADEAANAAVYLASEKASFITGQIMAVDGGRTVLDPLATPER